MKFDMRVFIKKGSLVGALLCLLTAQVLTHEMHEFSVTRFWIDHDFIMVDVNDTVKGIEIVCAAYDASGALLGSETWYTDNLATRAQISYNLKKKVASVRCVKN